MDARLTIARLIIDGPAPGAWNMAVDEALFQAAQPLKQCTLRLYQWSEPTVSLGYFQPAADRRSHLTSRGCPGVRRSTGGGAIVHDRELTYCLVAPIAHDRSPASLELVRIVHESLVRVLGPWGLAAGLCGASAVQARRPEPFLCFQRRTALDVVAGPAKVAGSAQRRLRGTLLQHGSILVGRSPAAPELPGIADLSASAVTPESWRDSWLGTLEESLQWRLQTGTLTPLEQGLARELEQSKYSRSSWNDRR